jgi:hypothetical protein
MHIIASPQGPPMCHHCARPFELDPREEGRERKLAQLRAIEDDDHAARAFHFHRECDAHIRAMSEVWVDSFGMHVPDFGVVRVEGIKFSIEPGMADAMLAEIDKTLLPAIRQSIIDALDSRLPPAPIVGPYNPTWCPDQPSVQALYPFGYVRLADGTVVAGNSSE